MQEMRTSQGQRLRMEKAKAFDVLPDVLEIPMPKDHRRFQRA